MSLFWKCPPNEITTWVSVLIPSFNTPAEYLHDCFNSISSQRGNFGIELVIINDGSTYEYTSILENTIHIFKKSKNNLNVTYIHFHKNKGISYCLNRGILLCSHDLIIRMDSDDIMHESRIMKQISYMIMNPDCVISGTNMACFVGTNDKKLISKSSHNDYLSWETYKIERKKWILNHPTLVLRKSAVLDVGNYNESIIGFEDLDLELRLMKKYGHVSNISEILLLYRNHDNNTTIKNPISDDLIQSHIEKIILDSQL